MAYMGIVRSDTGSREFPVFPAPKAIGVEYVASRIAGYLALVAATVGILAVIF